MLSKTDFLMYLDAPMHLWARTHDQLTDASLSQYEQFLIRQGQQVEALAKEYLTERILPAYRKVKFLWQPMYSDNRFSIRADALVLDQDSDTYDLYEIKSSTSVKTDHEYDLSFQVLLLEKILKLGRINLLHIDRSYQHCQQLDLEKFFVVEEISDKVEKRRDDVAKWREEAWAVSQMDSPLPSFACTNPKSCPCPNLCHPNLPKRAIYNLPYIGKKAIHLREMGITAIKDIPETFNLSIKQHKHFEAVKTNQTIIDAPAIAQSLASLQYPIYFLDYETFNPAVPLFRDYRPYQHIVFQYSLYVIEKPGNEPKHFECLLTDSRDPAPELATHLLDHLGPQGSVVVWNQSFEAQRNKELAEHCPDQAARLLGINDRLFDLMVIFKDGHYVHPDFNGSASLKAVLPVMCPELKYDELAISDGTEAMLTWYRLQTDQIPAEARNKTEREMLAYCELDTFGMIAIWEKLRETLRRVDES